MRMRAGLLSIFLIAVLLAAFPAAAAATVPASADVLAADGPAVESPPEVEEEEEQPWTARFLAPTVLLIGLVAIGGSILYYGIRIRGRYRVTQ